MIGDEDKEAFVAELQGLMTRYSLNGEREVVKILREYNATRSQKALQEAAKPEIIKLYKEGYSFKEIMAKINYVYRSPVSIRQVLLDAGVSLRGHGTRSREELCTKIIELREQGFKNKQISHIIGYSTSGLTNLINRMKKEK